MPRVVGIDHVQLAMPPGEERKARAFYTGLLGLAEVPKPLALAARGGAWFEDGSVRVHLGVEPGFRPAKKAYPGLVVDGLDELVAKLRAANVDVIADDAIPHLRRYHIEDPFGNRLELLPSP